MFFKNKFDIFIRLARLNRPTAILFLLLPCLFAIFFVTSEQNLFKLLQNIFFLKIILLFAIGSLIMRSAGCVINDIIDRKIDKKVARTSSRPLANQEISLFLAFIFLGFLLLAGFIILLQFNQKTIISGFFALILVIFYPFMKRIIFYPQIFLGITFNFGILMADLALNNQISLSTLFLYISAIFWTLIYDTIYGFQDIEDDLKIGVKSTAIKFRKNPKKILTILAIFMLFFLFLAGFLQKMSIFYFIFILFAAFYKIYLIKKCNYNEPQNCLKTFKKNYIVGFLILFAIIFGSI